MKKRVFRIIILALVIVSAAKIGVFDSLLKPGTVKAFGDLIVNFHVPTNAPIFTVTNMKPGDPPESRNIDVSNGGSTAHIVAVKGVRSGGVGADPKLESVLDLVINNGTADVYGGTAGIKTVADFFSDSLNPDGIQLGNLSAGSSITYTFKVTFPSASGNDFQAKSVIFDIIFGDGTAPSPTPTNTPTPTLTPTPTPSGNLCNNIKVNIFGNGTGSVNGVVIVCKNFKVVSQSNTTIVNTVINSTSNTGGNTSSGNTNTSTTTTSGSSTNTTTVKVKGGKNTTH